MDLHAERPCVYLDKWVWVRLAKAAEGDAREPADVGVLAAVRTAATAGVAFPLSSTHYIELEKTKNPRKRLPVARLMAEVSRCRTLRSRRVLLRHQMLNALHEHVGRPAFRPRPPEPLGVGAAWAFLGSPGAFRLHGPSAASAEAVAAMGENDQARLECRITQAAELLLLCGPADDQVEALRAYGYRPEETAAVSEERREWEEMYRGILRDDPVSRTELRTRLQARELLHEHFEMFTEVLDEYRIPVARLAGAPAESKRSRAGMVTFADRMPTMRIAVDMKARLFSDHTRTWKISDIHDIDALSMAIPYCHIVVADKDATVGARLSPGVAASGTRLLKMPELPGALTELAKRAAALPDDGDGWDWLAPGAGFDPQLPTPLATAMQEAGLSVAAIA